MPAIAPMTIADLARASGVDVASLRSYQAHGFFSPTGVGEDGAALFQENDVATVTFVLRAQGLGFSTAAIGELLMLSQRKPGHGCADVYEVIDRQLDDIRQRMHELANLERLLAPLAMSCPRRGGIDHCPVIATLQQPI